MGGNMKVILCAINSKYIHSSLAPWYLLSSIKANSPSLSCEVYETTINVDEDKIISDLAAKEFDVIGFSTYIWNVSIVLRVAEKIKKMKNAKIILGGPEVSYNSKEILEKYHFIDYILSGEGEESMVKLLNGENPSAIDGVCYRSGEEIVISPPAVLKMVPISPYTTEYFENLNGRIAYIETSRGCPFNCAFCLSGRHSGVRFFDVEQSKRDIIKLANSGTKTIKFVDRTFNADRKRAIELFSFIIGEYGKKVPRSVCFHFEIEGELLDEETFRILSKAPKGLFQFEIGIQSFNSKTLDSINRRCNIERLVENIKRVVAMKNVHVHIDLIVGLPYETMKVFEESFNAAYWIKADMLQIGFLKLLHGAQMREKSSKYPCAFSMNPPYEIISNEWLTKSEIRRLKAFENVFDRIYNSGRFIQTLEYVFSIVGSPFDFFMSFSEYYKMQHEVKTLDQLTKCLFEFLVFELKLDKQVVRDKLVRDRFSTNRMCQLPEFLKIHSPQIKSILRSLEMDESTKLEKGKVRKATLLPSEGKFIYVDYQINDKVKKIYEIREIFIKKN